MHIHHGEIRLTADELSSGGYGLAWGHSRTYTNRLPEDIDFGNGYNWLVPQWPHVEEEGAGTLVTEFDPEHTYWFDLEGQAFVGRYGVEASLSYDSQNDVYTLSFHKGETWQFYGFEPGTLHPGQLQRAVGAAGQVSEVVSFTATDRIAEIQRSYPREFGSSTVESFLYSYATGGDGLERLQQVTLRRRPQGLDWQPVARVSYTYYDGSTAHGSLGDLQLAARQVLSEDGSSWVDGQVRYYRYYKQGDANGFPHGLKYALEPQAYQKMVADGHAPATASEATLAGYASYYFEYDGQRRVTKETTPGGRSTTFTRTARPQPHATGMNEWTVKTAVVRPDGAELVVYGNELGQPIVKELNQGGDTWVEHWQYDAEGRMTLHATPAAVASYDKNTGPSSLVLDTDEGLVELFDYYTSTTTGSGGYAVKGYPQYDKIRRGSGGTAITLREYRYTEQSAGGVTVYPPAKTIVFRNDDGTGAIETSYSYLWHTGIVQMLERTTTLPAVPADQNGSGSSATRVERFDESGNLVWNRDERGYITYIKYDPATGVMTRRIDDVDGSQLTLPGGWSTPAGGGLHLVSDYEHDALGRTTQVLGPPHRKALGVRA